MKTVLLACLLLAPPQEEFATDGEGFVRNWLVLAPVPCEGADNGAVEIDQDQLKGEAKLTPKAGDAAKANGKELTWKAHQTKDFFIDFLASFGGQQGEDVIGWAVAYVHAEADQDVKLQVGSNDQCKAWVNGVLYVKNDEGRTLEKDQNSANVTLKKGCNAVVLKVINEKNNWQGCVRFTDKTGAALKSLKVTLAPR
jgi:hypothetical protein